MACLSPRKPVSMIKALLFILFRCLHPEAKTQDSGCAQKQGIMRALDSRTGVSVQTLQASPTHRTPTPCDMIQYLTCWPQLLRSRSEGAAQKNFLFAPLGGSEDDCDEKPQAVCRAAV